MKVCDCHASGVYIGTDGLVRCVRCRQIVAGDFVETYEGHQPELVRRTGQDFANYDLERDGR